MALFINFINGHLDLIATQWPTQGVAGAPSLAAGENGGGMGLQQAMQACQTDPQFPGQV
jgi:hypothetical protein